MNVLIRYYSGAGNTKYIANKIAKSLLSKAHQATCEKITDESNKEHIDNQFDMLGIGFPVYFREAPEIVYDLLNRINGKKRPIFLFTTKGLYSGNAVRNIMKYSIGQDFQPVGSIEFYMPGTDSLILFAKKGSITEKFLKRIHSRNIDEKISKFVSILEGITPQNIPQKKWYTMIDDSVIKKLETMYDNHHRDYIGQFYSNPDTCIECMKCIEGCPRHNIVLNAHIEFGTTCDVCFSCIHHCSTDSIQIGKITEDNARYNTVELL